MNYYDIYGLTIQSEFAIYPFERNKTHPENADITIQIGKVPDNLANAAFRGAHFSVSPNESIMTIPQVATFHIRDGKSIVIRPLINIEDITCFLISDVLPIIFHQRGQLALIASVIQSQHGAILLACQGSFGKSTLATALTTFGEYTFVSDDLAVIDYDENNGFVVHAGFPYASLWEYALEQLNVDVNDLMQVRSNLDRYYYAFDDCNYTNQSIPIHRIYVINYFNKLEIEIKHISGVEKFMKYRNNIHQPRYILDAHITKQYWQNLTRLSNQTQLKILSMPTAFLPFEQIFGVISKDIDQSIVEAGMKADA